MYDITLILVACLGTSGFVASQQRIGGKRREEPRMSPATCGLHNMKIITIARRCLRLREAFYPIYRNYNTLTQLHGYCVTSYSYRWMFICLRYGWILSRVFYRYGSTCFIHFIHFVSLLYVRGDTADRPFLKHIDWLAQLIPLDVRVPEDLLNNFSLH